jgi:flagellar basal-body rod protein FlgF
MSQQLFYLALGGLNATLDRMTAAANNLANANTTGFKAQQPVFRALPLYGQGLPDRVVVQAGEDSADFKPGAIEQTGRSLDVAVKGTGWIAVQAADGQVALTRNGSLSIAPGGLLQTSDGRAVLGQGNTPISLPPLQSVTIGTDGTISGALVGQTPDQIAAVNRIALVDPPAAAVKRRSDGLFGYTQGTPTPDAKVQLQIGALEGSNTNTVGVMMNMIENTRVFQMQTEMVRLAGSLAQGQGTPLSLT